MNGAPKRDTLEIIEDATFEEICNYDKTLDHAEARDLTSNIMNRVPLGDRVRETVQRVAHLAPRKQPPPVRRRLRKNKKE